MEKLRIHLVQIDSLVSQIGEHHRVAGGHQDGALRRDPHFTGSTSRAADGALVRPVRREDLQVLTLRIEHDDTSIAGKCDASGRQDLSELVFRLSLGRPNPKHLGQRPGVTGFPDPGSRVPDDLNPRAVGNGALPVGGAVSGGAPHDKAGRDGKRRGSR
jgi:hypothetical protein